MPLGRKRAPSWLSRSPRWRPALPLPVTGQSMWIAVCSRRVRRRSSRSWSPVRLARLGPRDVTEPTGAWILAVEPAQLGEHVLVGESDIHDCVVTGVVDDHAAVVAAKHAAREHDVGDVHVVGVGDTAVGAGREKYRDT